MYQEILLLKDLIIIIHIKHVIDKQSPIHYDEICQLIFYPQTVWHVWISSKFMHWNRLQGSVSLSNGKVIFTRPPDERILVVMLNIWFHIYAKELYI